ncbi:unnamed protein product [Somion occarium]|uniref:Uncharacterized protein n=1 Tax=Somion occarium TaxID=3059160 RepID=A0ABP1E784_9APHY
MVLCDEIPDVLEIINTLKTYRTHQTTLNLHVFDEDTPEHLILPGWQLMDAALSQMKSLRKVVLTYHPRMARDDMASFSSRAGSEAVQRQMPPLSALGVLTVNIVPELPPESHLALDYDGLWDLWFPEDSFSSS